MGVYALPVESSKAQETLKVLISKGIYDKSRKVLREGGFVYFPLKKKLEGAVEKELPKKSIKLSLKEKYGISAFDVIGNIATVLIPESLMPKKHEIGEYLMELYPRIRAVYHRGKVVGEYRIPQLELIAGEDAEVVYKEKGLRFVFDLSKVYFSPRQASEREKLLKYVRDGDVVAVFFSGIAPIPIYFSKFTRAKQIYAVELNPDACKYAEKNISLNKCRNIKQFCGDVRELSMSLPVCDLVVMPLPHGAGEFLKEAHSVLKPRGRIILYLGETEESLKPALKRFEESGFKLLEVRRELEIGPREWRFVVYGEKVAL